MIHQIFAIYLMRIFCAQFLLLSDGIAMEEPINDDETTQSITEAYHSCASIKGIISHIRENHISTFDTKPVSEHTASQNPNPYHYI